MFFLPFRPSFRSIDSARFTSCRHVRTLFTLCLAAFLGCGIEASETAETAEPEVGQIAQSLIGTPVVSSIKGAVWSYPVCSNTSWEYSIQVAYAGRSSIPVRASGSGLDRITAVTLNGTYGMKYSVAITGRTATTLDLDLRAVDQHDEGTKPMTDATFTFFWDNPTRGSTTKTTKLLPCLNRDNQCWGQCTWHVLMRRLELGLSPVNSYSEGKVITGEPGSTSFPRPNGVLMTASTGHMAILDTVTLTRSTPTATGEDREYALGGTQRNADCKGSFSRFSTTLKVRRTGSTWSVVNYPTVVGKSMTKIVN